MTAPLKLVIFDVDGTLVDSQGDIVAAMANAFDRAGHPAPSREATLGIVGLSLDKAIPRLAPELGPETHSAMVEWYKDAYVARAAGNASGCGHRQIAPRARQAVRSA
jgi:phosphoglycolate phosphatase